MMKNFPARTVRILMVAALIAVATQFALLAQRGGPVPAAGRASAPVDLTGYYVSVVTEDWRFRMVTPPKGDYSSVPLNPAARAVADAWDPAKDEAAGEQCRSYGAPAIMRVPGRIHITWQDDANLKVETDAGTQTRLFHFADSAAAGEGASWQGYSSAIWQPAEGGGRGGSGGSGGSAAPGGSLKVVTTHLKPGYLRKNGIPYSANAVVTEYYSRTMEPNGDSWLIVTTIVEDPQYLTGPFVTSTNFKRQADGSGWAPSACTSK
jgi:hypothetical protein